MSFIRDSYRRLQAVLAAAWRNLREGPRVVAPWRGTDWSVGRIGRVMGYPLAF